MQTPQTQFVLTQPQALNGNELDHQGNGMRPQGNTGMPQPSRNLDSLALPSGLPPRPPGVHASHSSSLYPPHDQPDQQDCSTRDTSPDWQPNDEDTGTHSQRNNAQGGMQGGMPHNHQMNAGRQSSSGGALPPITKPPPITRLKGCSDNLTQVCGRQEPTASRLSVALAAPQTCDRQVAMHV